MSAIESSQVYPQDEKDKFMSGFLAMQEVYGTFFSWFYEFFCAQAVVCAGEPTLTRLIADRDSGMPSGARVLDVGTGGGQHAVRIASQRPDIALTAVDNSRQQLKVAKSRADNAGCKNITFAPADGSNLPYDDNTFHAVYSVGIIKHVPDPALVFSELCRVLKPGGTIMVLDVDRGATFKASRAWAARTRTPRFLEPLIHYWFRKYVQGQATSRDEVKSWWDQLPLADATAPHPVPGDHPGWLVYGKKKEALQEQVA